MMPKSYSDSLFSHSLYWLLPVVALNVFTALGLREAMIELPSAPLTEVVFQEEDNGSAIHFLLAPAATTAAMLQALPDHPPAKLLGQMPRSSSAPTTPGIKQHLLCFHGKAAPEALDEWESSLRA